MWLGSVHADGRTVCHDEDAVMDEAVEQAPGRGVVGQEVASAALRRRDTLGS